MSTIKTNAIENIAGTRTVQTDNVLDRTVDKTGFKNIIINGGFDVWQRGTTATYAAGVSGYKTADRVISSNQAGGQFTISKSEINGSNAIRTTVDTPVTDLTTNNYWHGIRYVFEGQHLYSIAKQGKNVTISFLFNSNITGEFPVCMRNLTGTAVAGYGSYVTSFNYTTANTPQRVSITIPLGYNFTTPLQNNENRGLDIIIGFLNQETYVTSTLNQWQTGNLLTTPTAVNGGAAAGNFWEIAELQLEEGDTATPFERRPYGLELSLCQRYYEIIENIVIIRLNSGVNYGGTNKPHLRIAEKRSIPTITVISSTSSNGNNWEGVNQTTTNILSIWTNNLVNDTEWCLVTLALDAEL